MIPIINKVEWNPTKHSLLGAIICDHGPPYGEQVLVNMDVWDMLMAIYRRSKKTAAEQSLLANYTLANLSKVYEVAIPQ